MVSMKSVLVVPAFLIVAAGVIGTANAQEGGWRVGRGTFYGDQPWLWDIHKGSCGFGQLDPNKGTGWDITALPDVHYEYSNSCGCCGDMDHLDLSVYTFDKLAERRWGVIGIQYRPVACPGTPAQEVKTDGEGSRLNWLRKAFTDLNTPQETVQSFEG
ncbi:hypothetical protein BSKO_09549 [Bryopsis sp. KO-2023]|nr:hypothetical protein BSKO_09549 [Bryopsis sp. KO-2023]